ncbi:YciI family protein [Actinomadura rupiterrae]|uniref:YciI family protein n=1 Tax=Actinomadura rupiterrae TaxID=559627 RepID=UPI0020A60CBE|nr:YciI family protein [Actinomadura rupiterrae]
MMMIYAGSVGEEVASGEEAASGAADTAGFEAWQRYHEQVRDAGILVSSESLADLVTATTVRVDEAGERTVTDGPFAESREVLGGFYVIDVPDLDAALDWAARCPGSRGDGAVVVRPVADFGA